MDTQSGSRVRLSLRRKRTRLDLTSHPGDDDDVPQEAPLASGAPSSGSLDSKDCTQLGIKTGPHIKAEGTAWQETQPLSRKLRGRNANEPKGMGQLEGGKVVWGQLEGGKVVWAS